MKKRVRKDLDIDIIEFCFEYGKEAFYNHHVVPRVMGGTKTVPLCLLCHGKCHDLNCAGGGLVRMGLKKRKEEGLSLGRPPFGKRWYQDYLIIDELEQRTIDRILFLVEEGKSSYQEIADDLNGKGFKKRNGKV